MVTLKAIKRQQNLNNKRNNNRLSIINENLSPVNSQQTISRRESQNPTLKSPIDQNSKSPKRINSFNDQNSDQQINSVDDQNFEQIEKTHSFNDENLDQIEQINLSDSNQEQIDNVITAGNNNPSNIQIDSDDDSPVVSVMSNDFSNDSIIETI
ncbi:uncharacterized protein DDB_G0267764-like [Microplitis mediator]|uniref:uncharacterized protein DDB_G0267764-like n=1 Tax=Microplitis mediator TaxID=375433 RepID=UPI002557270A|nr:uncharacterized protein DDB_G0267764-like [Microplitis mediator]